MKRFSAATLSVACFSTLFTFCNNNQNIGSQTSMDSSKSGYIDSGKSSASSVKTEEVTYTSNGKESKGFIAYDENRKGKLPVVVIVPEWWGLGDYIKSRARKLAELGYFAFGADLFGNGKTAGSPQEAITFIRPYTGCATQGCCKFPWWTGRGAAEKRSYPRKYTGLPGRFRSICS